MKSWSATTFLPDIMELDLEKMVELCQALTSNGNFKGLRDLLSCFCLRQASYTSNGLLKGEWENVSC